MSSYKRVHRVTKGKRTRYGKDVDTTSAKHYNARQARTDYAATLINPELSLGARIPDLACYPTAVWTTEYHQPITISNGATTTNNQILALALNTCPQINCYTGTNGTSPGTLVTTTTPGSSSTPILIGDTVAAYQGRYKSARLVSAMIKMTWAGQDNATEGTILGTYQVPEYGSTVAPATVNFAQASAWATLPDAYTGPLKNGIVMRYKPVDAGSFDMQPMYSQPSVGLAPMGTWWGFFYINIIPAATTASTTFQLDVICNWEGTLTSNVQGIKTGMSGADPGALAHGLNAAGSSDQAFAATASSWSKNVDGVLRSVA